MIEKHTLAPASPEVEVTMTASEEAPGMYAVAFSWEPGSDVPVDHYRVVLTERPTLIHPSRGHWAEVTNRSGWLSWLVQPGESLWVTVVAVSADGERSMAAQLGVEAFAD